ncbi:LPO_1073/Vpar_1526 family protein [Gimibacter soli]|uniref:Uncharacterized protein n=1 Tax=Gimibacter soli TaxID=3024400 RepID=A0AAE9XQA4_9PROT|nr:LPO_1073/Vpar_1526 family protein [Gimibacter soli]WCL54289.1 hypothetical protein PH603_00760 [Gimibacter soli]
MIPTQKITTGTNSAVIQSGRDTNLGVSPEQMRQIVETLADQMPKYAAIAAEIVEARLKTFEEKIMDRFSTSESANPKAFSDPDFQYLLGKSQQAFARSGDQLTADVLVDLIAERSLQAERSRLTLSLNDAVERSALLTKNEFAELSLAFLLRFTRKLGLTNFRALVENLKETSSPLLKDISRESSSYSYLAAQACASVEIGTINFMDMMSGTYGGLISLGTPRKKFAAILGENFESDYPGIIVGCINGGTAFQADALNLESLVERMRKYSIEDKAKQVWNAHMEGVMNQEQFVENGKKYFDELPHLVELWQTTPLKHLELTSVGIAIAYANLKRVSSFSADLSIWIK